MIDHDNSPTKADRQDVRVPDLLRLRIQVIPPEDKEAVLDRMALERLTTGLDEPVFHSERVERQMQKHHTLPGNVIMNRLSAIEAKLDALIHFMTEKDLEDRWGAPIPVNFSAGGLMFPSDVAYEEGSLLRLELLMQTLPPRPIVTLSEVVRQREKHPEWHSDKLHRVGVRFVDIDTEDRDRIAHRVFDVQRMILRRAKDADDQESSEGGQS